MRQASIDDLDDPVLDVSTARLDHQTFRMDGSVRLQDGLLLYERSPRHPPAWRLRSGWADFEVSLRIDHAIGFDIDDRAQVGALIVEAVEVKPHRVVLHGTIPCTISVDTSAPSQVMFTVADRPSGA